MDEMAKGLFRKMQSDNGFAEVCRSFIEGMKQLGYQRSLHFLVGIGILGFHIAQFLETKYGAKEAKLIKGLVREYMEGLEEPIH